MTAVADKEVTVGGLVLQVLEARRSCTVGGGDCETSWFARLRLHAASGKSVEWIDFVVNSYEVNSERHDRESHHVGAQLSTGEKLTLYDSSYYEKYSRMKHGPGNAEDASHEDREKLATILTEIVSKTFNVEEVQALARSLEDDAQKAKFPGTVEERKTIGGGDPDAGRYDNCAQQ